MPRQHAPEPFRDQPRPGFPALIRSAASLVALVSAPAVLALASSSGCVSPGDGPSPPGDELYYPSGLAVSPGGHSLFIVNSDFDLQYNAGTVLALDLDRIRAMIPPVWDPSDPKFPCASLATNTQTILYPGRCAPIDLKSPADGLGTLVAATTQIGAFATDALVLAPHDVPTGTEARARLFVPVRGDPSVTYLEIADDRVDGTKRLLWCGQSGDSPRCAGAYRAGENAATNDRRAVLPTEPYGIAATEDGEALVVTHQTTGSLSLVTNPWGKAPTLQFVLGGFPYGPVGVATLPVAGYVRARGFTYNPGFLATFRAAPEVDTVRYYNDTAASPARPFISRTGAAHISVNASGVDSRGIVIDSYERKEVCEKACGSEEECLRSCASVPMGVFIANRSPPSLVVGEVRTSVGDTWADDAVTIFDSVPLRFGPSRVQLGMVIEEDGLEHRRVFVSCFDSRTVVIYDPARFRVDAEVHTGRGPHSLAFDPLIPLAYIGHFTDSYVGAVDLDRRHSSYGTIIASIGTPRPPRETK